MTRRLARLAAWLGRTSRTLRVTPMNLLLRHHVHPWKPGDVVPAAAFTAEQREWLTTAGAVQPTAAAATVPDTPPAPVPVERVSDAAAEILALRARLGTAPAEIARLKAELAAATAGAAEYEAMIADLEAKAKGLEAQLAQSRVEVQAARAGGRPAA